jgi:hypothetical protein
MTPTDSAPRRRIAAPAILAAVLVAIAGCAGTAPRERAPAAAPAGPHPLAAFDGFWQGDGLVSSGGDAQIAVSVTPAPDGAFDFYGRWLAAPNRRDVAQRVQVLVSEHRFAPAGPDRWAADPPTSPVEGPAAWALLRDGALLVELLEVESDGRLRRRTTVLRVRPDGVLDVDYRRRLDDHDDVLAAGHLQRR